ncbi:RDD family protein [Flavobacterium orientale]|nr:RDD family protein [Flavobacterium orientale]
MLATKGQRLANYLIDLVIHNIINVVPLLFAWILYEFFGNADLSIWLDSLDSVVDFFISYVIIVIYYMIMESITGRSLGKYVTNTKVLMADGTQPEPYAIFIRSISRLIPFNAFSFLGNLPKGWHDTLSKTVVVDIKKYNQEREMASSINEIGMES